MRIFLGSTIIDQLLEARTWVGGTSLESLFSSLGPWIGAKEKCDGWGDCYVFIEIPLPTYDKSAGSHNQVDMIICFSNRIALCELKRHNKAERLRLDKTYRQLTGQISWLKGLCGQNILDRDNFLSAFLVLPQFDSSELTKIRTAWIDRYHAHHILPVGTLTQLKGDRDRNNHSYHLVDALEERLSRSRSPIKRACLPLQLLIHEKITEAGSELSSFGDFNEAVGYLRENITPSTTTSPAPYYVPDLRAELLDKATHLLRREGVVEVMGPPEIGKSVFAKEIIQRAGYNSWELRLSQCNNPHAICTQINDSLRGESPQALGYEEFLRWLIKEPILFWVREYDLVSGKSLEQLLKAYKSFSGSTKDIHARWIIESVRPLSGLHDYRCELNPIERQGISRILQKLKSGGAFDDPEEAIRLAGGNPGRAIRYWQSLMRTDLEAGDEFEWFRRQLTIEEARILPILCMATERSPFGLTQGLLCSLVSSLNLDLPSSNIQTAVESLLHKLKVRQLASVSRLNKEIMPDSIIPAGSSVTLITDVARGLRESELKELSDASLNEGQLKLHDVLWDAAEMYTLSHVTVEINLGDLEPFLRSSFRFTHLSRLITWIDQTRWRYKDARQAYLLRALRVLLALGKRETIDLGADLGKPQSGDRVQEFAYNLAKIKSITFARVDKRFDLGGWLRLANSQSDLDLQAEVYVSAAMALPKSSRTNRAEEIWTILNKLWEPYEVFSSARCHILQETLAFLNRGKLWKGTLEDMDAHRATHEVSQELLSAGMRLENLQLISDALFYFIRSEELQAGRDHSPNVLTFLPALKFVEEAQGKTVRTIQVLLTQGSAHRHFLRQDNLLWDSASFHFEEGFQAYTRAFYSAWAKQHVTHILNATSYMMSLCCKGLRFTDDHRAKKRIAERSEQALAYADQALRNLNVSALDEQASSIRSTIEMSYPVLLYVTAVGGPNLNEESLNWFKANFRNVVDQLLQDAEPGGTPKVIEQSRKRLTTTITDLTRALRFGQHCSKTNRDVLMNVILTDLLRLVDGTHRIKKNGKPVSKNLSKIVSDWTSSSLT